MILPDLTPSDKVSVVTDKAQRGRIDRNGKTLASTNASSVGIVPGKLQNKEEAVKELALLLDMREETILQKLRRILGKGRFLCAAGNYSKSQ